MRNAKGGGGERQTKLNTAVKLLHLTWLTFGVVLVERRGDLLPLLELVLHGHHEAVEDGAGKQEATAIEKDKPTEIIQRY